jgi:hypothetical protein
MTSTSVRGSAAFRSRRSVLSWSRAFQADLIGAGVGPEARRESVVLLGGILQRATEGRRIA